MVIEKIGHIKNPLTIIAIFAGLAEVSGTAVLPFLKEDIQYQYIWFLMSFPFFIAGAFYYILYTNNKVLYAPSDYQSDEGFLASFGLKQSRQARIDKIKIDEDINKKERKTKEEKDEKTGEDRKFNSWEFRQKALMAEELFIEKLSKEHKIPFERNLSPIDDNTISFDAVGKKRNKIIIVEVKYTEFTSYPIRSLERILDRINTFYQRFYYGKQFDFEFVLGIILNNQNVNQKTLDQLKNEIDKIADNYPFDFTIETCTYQSLLQQENAD